MDVFSVVVTTPAAAPSSSTIPNFAIGGSECEEGCGDGDGGDDVDDDDDGDNDDDDDDDDDANGGKGDDDGDGDDRCCKTLTLASSRIFLIFK